MKYLSVDRFCELYKSCLSDVLLIHVPTNWYVTDGNVSLWRLHIFFPLHHILSVCSYSYLYQAVGMCIVTRNHYKNIVDTSFWYFICTIDTCDFDFIDTCTLKQTSSSAVYGSVWVACYCPVQNYFYFKIKKYCNILHVRDPDSSSHFGHPSGM